jgi:hypothetical protein
MATAQELFDDYNYYRSFTQHVKEKRDAGQWIRFLRETPERLASLAQMAAWCESRNYDPRHWLCWLFYRGHWRFARPFNQLIPSKRIEKKLIKSYKHVTDLPMYRQRMRELAFVDRIDTGQIYDSNRDLSATTEALKRRYLRLEDPDGCMQDERSCGYHPRSLVCARCIKARECEYQLRTTVNFDIIALRKGEVTSSQAYMEGVIRGR